MVRFRSVISSEPKHFFSALFVVIRCIRTPGVLYEEKIISFLSLSRRQEFAMLVFDPKVLIYSKQG